MGGIGGYWAVLGGIGGGVNRGAVVGGIGRYWAVLGGIGRGDCVQITDCLL